MHQGALMQSHIRQTSFGLLLLLALLLTGAGQVLPQGVVGHGGWELDRAIGRGTVEDLAVSPDGSALAVAGSHGIWIYSLPALELLRHIGAGGWLFDVEWSPDSRFVAAGGRNDPALYHLLYGQPMADEPALTAGYHSIRIWDVASGALIRTLQDSDFTARFAWSPAGDMVAAVSNDGVLRIHDVAGGVARELLWGYPGFAVNLAWSPDGTGIVTPTFFGLMEIDVFSGARRSYGNERSPPETATFLERALAVMLVSPPVVPDWWDIGQLLDSAADRHAVWSPDGSRLALGTSGLTVLQPPASDVLFHISEKEGGRTSMAPVWSPDGKRLAQDARINAFLREPDSGEVLLRLRHHNLPLDPLGRDYGLTGMAWSPDGSRLATAGRDKRIVVHDTREGGKIAEVTLDAVVQDLAWPRDREFLVSATSTGDIHVWDARDGKPLAVTTEHNRATPWYLLRHTSWGPDSRRLYAAGRYLDAGTGQPVSSANWPQGVIPSPDHKLIADPVQKEWTVVLRDAETLEALKELEHDSILSQASHIVWSSDGNSIALGSDPFFGGSSYGYGYALWDTGPVAQRTAFFQEGALQVGKRLQNPTLAWSPDGILVATNVDTSPTSDRDTGYFSVLLRYADDGSVYYSLSDYLPAPSSRMSSLDWSPDGGFLAGGVDDGSLHVWDMDWSGSDPPQNWKIQQVVENQGVNALAWSPDGTKLAAGTASLGDPLPGVVLVYDWKNGVLENEARLPGHSVGIVSLAWSPYGSYLASTDLGGVVHVWRRSAVG